jgi:hypothetical protein
LILFEMFDGASLYQAPIRVIIWTEKIACFVKFSCETARTKSNSLVFVPSRTFSDRWCTPFLSVRVVTAVNEFKISFKIDRKKTRHFSRHLIVRKVRGHSTRQWSFCSLMQRSAGMYLGTESNRS